MAIDYKNYNSSLNKKLQALSKKDKEYWSFKGNANRDYGHGMFQYPAMMVPQVTSAIIDKIVEVQPSFQSIRDPFVGSGTVLTESMLRGLSFYGTDINPLAILLCQVKSGPFFIDILFKKAEELKAIITNDKDTNVEVNFPNRNKWFTKSAQIWLSKIRRSIQADEECWARKFFWIALAETIRLISNSRTSTFKLHIRAGENIIERKTAINILGIFYRILDHNLTEYKNLYSRLQANNLLKDGYYKKTVSVTFADIRTFNYNIKSDVIITSPPYGDNDTTVPYGQHSYLPLQWIDFSDIDENINKDDLLRSTHEIDYRSLGGHRRITKEEMSQLLERSDNLKNFTDNIHDKPKDRVARVTTFFRDLDLSIDPILKNLNDGGIMVWVLGNRKVGGKRVPLDKILADLLAKRNVTVFCELTRKIPSKRMALKNNIAETMSDEIILLMRKVG